MNYSTAKIPTNGLLASQSISPEKPSIQKSKQYQCDGKQQEHPTRKF